MNKKYKIVRTQYNSRRCIVCGLDNAMGLRASFYETDTQELIAVCTPMDHHQSYPNRLHGGISSALLDETIGRAICVPHDDTQWGVTMELLTRYKLPVPLNQEIKIVGRITNERGKFFEGTGEIYLPDGRVAATATGKYMRMTIDNIASSAFTDDEWGLLPESPMPEFITIGVQE